MLHLQPFEDNPAAAKLSCWTSWQSMQLAWSQGLPIASAKPESWRPWVSLHWEQQDLSFLHELKCKDVCAVAIRPAPINTLHAMFVMRIFVITSWSMWATAVPTLHAKFCSHHLAASTSCNGTAELACSCFQSGSTHTCAQNLWVVPMLQQKQGTECDWPAHPTTLDQHPPATWQPPPPPLCCRL